MLELPLWIRDTEPNKTDTWKRLNGVRMDGLPDGYHTGGAWYNGQEVWKPLDGRPYANAECHYPTQELACLEALAGRPGFPRNWRVEEREYSRDGETVTRRWLVRPWCFVIGQELDKNYLDYEKTLQVEQIMRGMNEAGWELNDPISIALDPDEYEPFVLDLSVAVYCKDQDGIYAPDDFEKIMSWFEWTGMERLVKLRRAGRKIARFSIEKHDMIERGEWPGKEWRHVYASYNRPVSLLWASRLKDAKAHLAQGNGRVHTWVVTPEPLDEDTIYSYELTWAWSPLCYE